MCRYLAPEYAENGIVSVRTDVYSFGIVLIQLISGRKAVDSAREDQQSLRQWVRCLEDFCIFLKNEKLFTIQLTYLLRSELCNLSQTSWKLLVSFWHMIFYVW